MASNTERYPADVFNTWMKNVDWNWRFEIFKESEEFFFFFFFPLTALKNSRENGLNFPAVIWNDTFARRITIINKTARLDGKSYQLQWYVDRPIPVLWKTKVFHFFFFFFREYQKYQLDNSVLWNSKSTQLGREVSLPRSSRWKDEAWCRSRVWWKIWFRLSARPPRPPGPRTGGRENFIGNWKFEIIKQLTVLMRTVIMRYPVKQNIAVQINVCTSNVMLKQSSTITANLRNESFPS